MLKKHEIIFSTIKLPLDFLIIVGSFFIAREIRMIPDLMSGFNLPNQTIHTDILWNYSLFGGLLYILLFTLHGLYNTKIIHSKIKEFTDIIQYGIYWFLFFSVSLFFLKGIIIDAHQDLPRLIILFTLCVSTICVILQRIILNSIQYKLLSLGYIDKRSILIVTQSLSEKSQHIIDDINKADIYTLKGYINSSKIPSHGPCKQEALPYLGNLKTFQKMSENNIIDEVLFLGSDFSKKELKELWNIVKIFGIRYRYVPHLFDIKNSNTHMSLIYKVPVIEIESTQLLIWGRTIKRISDIVFSFIGIITLSPFLALLYIIIKVEDPGAPAIYKNKRIGQNGKKFILYKFRYMQWKYCIKEGFGITEKNDGALTYEKNLIKKMSTRNGPLYKIKDDPRKTQIGYYIEKYSIDELPQLFNVLIGNMSLVGPRPHQPREVQHYEMWAKRLLTIKPGMTGMAQVNGREKNDFKDEASLDIMYIENWNILLDVKILFKTLYIVLGKK